MRLTNVLLCILICLIAFSQLPRKRKAVAKSVPTIQIQKREVKNVIPEVLEKNRIRHSTTFRNYIDSDGRNSESISHNIRVGKDYYISGSLTTRETYYNEREVSGELSVTKYW